MAKKEFTATEVMALQERLEKGIAVIGEQHGAIITKLNTLQGSVDAIREQVAENTMTLTVHGDMLDSHGHLLKSQGEILKEHGVMLKEHGQLLRKHDQDIESIKDDLQEIKADLRLVKTILVHKADMELFQSLNERVIKIEQKLAHIV